MKHHITPNPNWPKWVVLAVEPHEDFTMNLIFNDGTERLYDAKTQLLKLPIMKKLTNKTEFMRARVSGDSVIWDDELDVAPEHLYECSQLLHS